MKELAILIAEDDVLTRKEIRGILERGGYRVCAECGNGIKAVEMAKSSQPDLAILDIKMPGIDGLEVAKILHSLNVPVIMIMGYSHTQYINRAENIHVCGYLVKPVSENNVLAAVRIAYTRWVEILEVNRELSETKELLQHQKLISRANAIIADRESISMQEAYQLLTQSAMQLRLSMVELARQIIG